MQWMISGFLISVLSLSIANSKTAHHQNSRGWNEDTQENRVEFTDLRRQLQAQAAKNHHSLGYKGARTELLGRISLTQDKTGYVIKDVYCEENYGKSQFRGGNGPAPGRIPDDKVLNTEHTWPQSRFGGQDREKQKSDLHHLFPTDSEMNGIRGNFPFGEVQNNERHLKCTCSRAGDDNNGNYVFEAPEAHRGNVARALFYFSVRYGMAIDTTQEGVLRKWDKQDPVDASEVTRNDEIEKVQGNRNPFIDRPELADQITNF